MPQYVILAINPGSTSTKIAVYENEAEIFKKNIQHQAAVLAQFACAAQQYDLRREAVAQALRQSGIKRHSLAAVVGRGGVLPPVKSGAYKINALMVDRLRYRSLVDHAANLGGILAYEIAKPLQIPALIYDSVAVDELSELARITGFPAVARPCRGHTLNMRSVAMKIAQKYQRPYAAMNLIVAHLGSGITVSLHQAGQMVDGVFDDEGPFSPERAGGLPGRALVKFCCTGAAAADAVLLQQELQAKGGLLAYLGTNEALAVEKRIDAGEQKAALVYQAMAYQIAKAIGQLAVVVSGKVDAIIITGGLAYSQRFVGWIKELVSFLAPVEIVAGENELEALALGALRVLRGEEVAREYDCD